jgi:2-methylcitrate dehydratase PrpD
VQQAQFSMPFVIGAVLARGELGVEALSEEALFDPRVRAAMEKVEMRRVDALHSDDAPEGSRVTVVTRDGREFSDYLGQPTGMPGNPMPDDILYAKFLRCAAAGGMRESDGRRLLERLIDIENISSVSARLFTVDRHDAEASSPSIC